MMTLMIEGQGVRELTNQMFDAYLNKVISYSGSMVTIAKYLAFMGVCVKMLLQYLNPNQRTNVWGYFGWMVLAFFLLNYSTFISSIFWLYDVIAKSLASNSIDWDTAYKELEFAARKATQTTVFSQETLSSIYENGLMDTIYENMKVEYTSKVVILSIIIIKIVSTVVYVFVKAYSVIYLMILVVFGPINIGLSFIPSLDGMWKGWLQKLLNVLMWIPMLYLIDAFMLGLIDNLHNALLTNSIDLGKVLGAAMLSGMSIFMYIKAPSLSNFIVQGSSVGKLTMGSQSKDAAGKVMQAAKTVAKVKSGNITALTK